LWVLILMNITNQDQPWPVILSPSLRSRVNSAKGLLCRASEVYSSEQPSLGFSKVELQGRPQGSPPRIIRHPRPYNDYDYLAKPQLSESVLLCGPIG